MITSRDFDVIDFLEEFKIARTSTIAELFYPSLLVCQNRLKALHDYKEVKRARDSITSEYLYYLVKPKQVKHSLLLTDFYRELSKKAEIVDFKNEVSIGNLRADGLVAYKYKGKGYVAFVEVQIANTPLNINKYLLLLKSGEYRNYFPVFPKLIAITNKKIERCELDIIQVREDLGGMFRDEFQRVF